MPNDCLLCGSIISVRYRRDKEESWKAEYQLLMTDPTGSRLIEPDKGRHSYPMRFQFVVHRACWNIVERAAGISDFSHEWLLCFVQCMCDIGGFLNHIDYPQAPDRLDSNLDGNIGNGGGIPMDRCQQTNGVFDRFNLPAEIIQMIFMFLDSREDILSLQEASLIEASPRVWLSLGHRFRQADARFREGSVKDIGERVRRALRNLEDAPNTFPHTRNHDTVWKNVTRILDKTNMILGKGFIDKGVTLHDFRHSQKRVTIPLQRINAARRLLLHFVHLNHAGVKSHRPAISVSGPRISNYLCGIQVDGDVVGWEGDVSVALSPESLCGIRMAYHSKFIFAVQVKTGAGWEDEWHINEFEPRSKGLHSFTKLEWQPGSRRGSLAIFYNTYNISQLAFSYDLGQDSMEWKGGTPLPHLVPIPLMDVVRPKEKTSYNFFQCNINKISAIDGYLLGCPGLIVYLEIRFEDGTCTKIGSPHKEASPKLSFHINRAENEFVNAIGFAKHPIHEGISLKVYTSMKRVVTFGHEKAEKWSTIDCQHGLYFSSQVSRPWILQNLGYFRPYDSEYSPSTKVSGAHESARWSQAEMRWREGLSCGLKKQKVLVSRAPLSDISHITVYHGKHRTPSRENAIIGLKVFYKPSLEESRPPMILGEVRDTSTSVEIPDRIRRISCHYSVSIGKNVLSCKIKGLEIDCGYEKKNIEIGDKTPRVQYLTVSGNHAMLYWRFEHDISHLSLSEKDIDIDKLVAGTAEEQGTRGRLNKGKIGGQAKHTSPGLFD